MFARSKPLHSQGPRHEIELKHPTPKQIFCQAQLCLKTQKVGGPGSPPTFDSNGQLSSNALTTQL